MVDWQAYAAQRRSLSYYAVVRQYIERHSPAKSILEIGPGGTNIVLTGEFERRTVVNREPLAVEDYPGVEVVIAEWPTLQLKDRRFDVVVCCQVLEHLTDAHLPAFADALLNAGRRLVVSVPYHWPKGACEYHPQDPVTLVKLIGWMGREPYLCQVVREGSVRRLVAEFAGNS